METTNDNGIEYLINRKQELIESKRYLIMLQSKLGKKQHEYMVRCSRSYDGSTRAAGYNDCMKDIGEIISDEIFELRCINERLEGFYGIRDS